MTDQSKITKWSTFKKKRLNYYSAILFFAIFSISLGSEFIANDKPFFIWYDSNAYWPTLNNYPETTFGGDFDSETEYKDPWIMEKIDSKGFALWPLIPFHHTTIDLELGEPAPSPPDERHWLGTDDTGRDVVARLLYGLRISVLFSIILTISTGVIGIAAGAVQGYFGGWVDLVFQRVIEIWSGIPIMYVLIIISSIIQPSFWMLYLILLLVGWSGLVPVVRAEFLKVRKLEYVRAAKALGMSDFNIMLRHILPNAMVATVTAIPFILITNITILTTLDFLGFGLPAGSASLGEMVAQSNANLHAPWIGISTFVVTVILLSLLMFIGQGLQDALDSKSTLRK